MQPSTHDHQRCIENALHTAERLCRERGVRLTPLRKKVLELVWADHRAVKAYDLLESLGDARKAAKPPTVYRALDFLAEQGLIHRVESLNAFIGCNRSGNRHPSLLFICRLCGDVEEHPAPEVMRALAGEAEEAGFQPEHQTIELIGTCAHCAKRRG